MTGCDVAAVVVVVGEVTVRVKVNAMPPGGLACLETLTDGVDAAVREWLRVSAQDPSVLPTSGALPGARLASPPRATRSPDRPVPAAVTTVRPAVAAVATCPRMTMAPGAGETGSPPSVAAAARQPDGPPVKAPPLAVLSSLAPNAVPEARLERARNMGVIYRAHLGRDDLPPPPPLLNMRVRVWIVVRGGVADAWPAAPSLHDWTGSRTALFGTPDFGYVSRVGETGRGGPPALFAGFPSVAEVRAFLRGAQIAADTVLDCRRRR